jgi:hypothetical protein
MYLKKNDVELSEREYLIYTFSILHTHMQQLTEKIKNLTLTFLVFKSCSKYTEKSHIFSCLMMEEFSLYIKYYVRTVSQYL